MPEDFLIGRVVAKNIIDTDTGDHVPTIRVRRIEPLGPVAGCSDAVKKAVAAAESERTGRSPIPFEIVEVGEHPSQHLLDADMPPGFGNYSTVGRSRNPQIAQARAGMTQQGVVDAGPAGQRLRGRGARDHGGNTMNIITLTGVTQDGRARELWLDLDQAVGRTAVTAVAARLAWPRMAIAARKMLPAPLPDGVIVRRMYRLLPT